VVDKPQPDNQHETQKANINKCHQIGYCFYTTFLLVVVIEKIVSSRHDFLINTTVLDNSDASNPALIFKTIASFKKTPIQLRFSILTVLVCFYFV